MAKKAGNIFIRALGVGIATYSAFWAIEVAPDAGVIHQAKHALGVNGVIPQFYTNLQGERVLGARCVICGKIGDEHPDHREPIDRARIRLHHAVWARRWGPKDHRLYLQRYETSEFKAEVEKLLQQGQYGPPEY